MGMIINETVNITKDKISLHPTPFLVEINTNSRPLNLYNGGLEWPFALALPVRPVGDLGQLLYIVLVATMVEPYASRREYSQRACTGTLLRSDLVLTLASCIVGDGPFDPDPTQTVIYRREGVPLRALKIFIFKGLNYAVIITEDSNQKEFPTLPDDDLRFSDVRNSCFLAGYGNQQRLLLAHFKMRWLHDLRIEELNCKEPNKLCLNFYNLIPCRGDMGSPLICSGHLYAIFAPRRGADHTRECIQRYMSVFQLVSPIAGWISQIIESPSTTLQWLNDPWYLVLFCVVLLAVIGGIYYCLIETLQKSFKLSLGGRTSPEGALTARSSFSSDGKDLRRWSRQAQPE